MVKKYLISQKMYIKKKSEDVRLNHQGDYVRPKQSHHSNLESIKEC